MKAWKLNGLGGALSLEDVSVPCVRPGSVLVRIKAAMLPSYLGAYVNGDLSYYQAPGVPFTPVGNAVGIVEGVGDDVWSIRPGQHVLLSSLYSDGGHAAEPGRILIGITALGPETKTMQAAWPDGVLAEYALYPVSSVTPADTLADIEPARLAALLRCAVPFGGLTRGRLAAGEAVIVTGASGSYGAAAVLVALALGAGSVIAAGRDPVSLDAVAAVGGSRVRPVRLTGDMQSDSKALREAAGGGAHLAFDMVGQAGDPNATLAALDALKQGGRLVLMGSMTTPLPLSYMQIVNGDLEIIGQFMYKADAIRSLVRLVQTKALNIESFKPTVFPLAELRNAIKAAANADSLECVVVQP